METKRFYRSIISSLGGLALVISVFPLPEITPPAIAASETLETLISQAVQENSQTEIAQASLCRRVVEAEGLVIRQRPTPNSPIVGRVTFNQEVTLIQGYQGIRGPDGRTWIEINAPVRGFISNGYPNGASNLILCSGSAAQPSPPASGSLCRQVEGRATGGRGLVVRSAPSELSTRLGGVPVNGKITLVPNYRLVPDADGKDRNWVQISSPVAGYVSAGNLIMCR